MKNSVVSLIVPIYNVEAYLEQCIESLINQSYSNLEIILVDDGSPDNCGKICDEWAKKDSRIKVIHKKNGGLSDARNFGLDNATGEYICFIDSDDYVDEDYVLKLLKSIQSNNVEVSQCNYARFYEDGHFEDVCPNYGKLVDSYELELKMSLNKWENNIVWNKMYSKRLFDDIRFPKGKIHENEYTTYKIYAKVDKVGIVEDMLYYYRQNSNSIMGSKFNPKRLQALDAFKERIEFYKDKNDTLFLNTILSYLYLNRELSEKAKILEDSIIIRKTLASDFNTYYKLYLNNSNNMKKNFRVYLFKNFPWLLDILYKLNDKRHGLVYKALKFNTFVSYFIKSKVSKNKIFILGEPKHGNIGDQAILVAEEKLLKDYDVINIESKYVLTNPNFIKKVIGDSTILYTGGGFLGSLWLNEENMFRETLKLFPNNKIIALPQTFYFSEDEKKVLEDSQKIYEAHKNLYLICREKYSYEFMKKNFKCNISLIPDMVLYLDLSNDNVDRKNILLCMRKDKEKTNEGVDNILNVLKDKVIDYTDTVVDYGINFKSRNNEVYNKINKFSKYQLVITDRLHGMIFAYLSKTPCIVINSKSYKLLGVYEWIKDCNYIKLYDEKKFSKDVDALLNLNDKVISDFDKSKYDEIIKLINE